MALTRSFKDTVQARAQRDPAFREALLSEGVDALLAGDVDTGKAVLRDYINATVGFEKLATVTGTPPKSLMRMFSPVGNPNARNLFGILGELQRQSGVKLHARSAKILWGEGSEFRQSIMATAREYFEKNLNMEFGFERRFEFKGEDGPQPKFGIP